MKYETLNPNMLFYVHQKDYDLNSLKIEPIFQLLLILKIYVMEQQVH